MDTIYPPYGKAGSTVTVTISGKPLEEITTLRFNNPVITAVPVTTPADEVYPEPRPVKNKFIITIPDTITPGIYEVRCLGYHGLSTARPFQILPVDARERLEEAVHDKPEKALPIAVGEGIYGTIGARNIEWFKLTAKKGQRYFATVWAERLDSKVDPQIRIFDKSGRELDRDNDYFTRDPLLDFTAPEDGDYHLAVSDILYRGGGDQHHYRFTVSQDPHIDFVWPPAGLPGTKQTFIVYGRNLPGGKPVAGLEIKGKPVESLSVTLDIPKEPTEPASFSADFPRRGMFPGFAYQIKSSNAVKVGFATAPAVLEDAAANHQTVPFPCEVAGKFDQPGDVDTYRFAAEKDRTYWLDLYSDRLGISTDAVLLVRKVGGDNSKPVGEVDDPPSFFDPKNHDATYLDTTDPGLSFTAPESGEYEAVVINQASSGSPTHLYRLAIRNQTPDFQLLTTTEQSVIATNGRAGFPASPLLRKNGTIDYRVVALRQDGFDGDIVVTAENLPAGLTAPPLVLYGKTDGGILTIKAGADLKPWSGPIRITGRTKIAGKDVAKVARNASLVWGIIFADSARVRSRLDLETILSTSDQESAPCYIEVANAAPLTVELNQDLEIPVKVTDFDQIRKGNLTVIPHGFPGLLRSPPNVTIAEGKSEGILKMKFKPDGNFKAAPGTYSFVLQGTGIAKHVTNPAALKKAEAEVARLKAAKTAATGNDALIKKLDTAITAAEKTKTDVEKAVKPVDTTFATCSLPVTVTVTAPPVKK